MKTVLCTCLLTFAFAAWTMSHDVSLTADTEQFILPFQIVGVLAAAGFVWVMNNVK